MLILTVMLFLFVEVDGLDGESPSIRVALGPVTFGKASLSEELFEEILFDNSIVFSGSVVNVVGKGLSV